MSFLHDFINVLKDGELEQLEKLRLPPRERNVLKTMVSFRHRELPEKAELLSGIGISPQHFDKITSVLLDKCYEIFVPERGLALLRFLTVKDLYKHFRHEMMMQEKNLLKAEPDRSQEFYLKCFDLVQSHSTKNYDEKLAQTFGRKYLASLKNPLKDDEIYVEARLLRMKILCLTARGRNIPQRAGILKELQMHSKDLEGSCHALALYSHYHGFAAYYTYLATEENFAEMMLEYLLKAAAVCDEFPEILHSGEKIFTKCKIAEAYYAASDFQRAFDEYDGLFKSGEIEKQKQFYHATKFAQLSIILDEFLKAEELLENTFGIYIASREHGLTTMAAISYGKLYLSNGECEKAKKYIDLGFELNAKNHFIQYEVELRNLQNTYFFLKEDWEMAEDLARRNLKFLNSKGFTLESSEYGHFYKILLACINIKLHGAKFPETMNEKYELYQTSTFAVYGKLLKIMRERAEKF